MVSVPTTMLSGPALRWAIESIEGQVPVPTDTGQLQLSFDTDPVDRRQCERLIAKYTVWVEQGHDFAWVADTNCDPLERMDGETRAIAVCRAVLTKTAGKSIKVPAELI